MTGDQPLLINAFEGEQEACRDDAQLAVVAVSERVQPADDDGAELAAQRF